MINFIKSFREVYCTKVNCAAPFNAAIYDISNRTNGIITTRFFLKTKLCLYCFISLKFYHYSCHGVIRLFGLYSMQSKNNYDKNYNKSMPRNIFSVRHARIPRVHDVEDRTYSPLLQCCLTADMVLEMDFFSI